MTFDQTLDRLSRSRFRARFHLGVKERGYAHSCGSATVAEHARLFVLDRLAPATPRNDGRQTPMRGHPVFIAQHATATCCRNCLQKWHGIARGEPLTDEQVTLVVGLLMAWLERELA